MLNKEVSLPSLSLIQEMSNAFGPSGFEEGPIAVEAAAIFITVPVEHFIENAPESFRATLFGSAAPELEINP